MKTRLFVVSLLPALLAILVFGLTGSVIAQENQHIEKPEMELNTDPAIASISPANFASGVNLPVTITGTDLSNVSSARLGDTVLRNLNVTSATQVTAQVPWSIAAGIYDLTVKSQGRPNAVLPGAVTVSPANNDWTSNGLYGGNLYDVVLDQQDASRMYVSANVSACGNQDSGASWNLAIVAVQPYRIEISYPAQGQPPVIYIGGDASLGLLRSLDYGQTWQEKGPTPYHPTISHVFERPDQPNWVYLALSGRHTTDPDVGLYVSPDQGESWSRLEGTAGLHATALAFDPDNYEFVCDGLQAIGVVGDQDLCAHHTGEVLNPALGVQSRFGGQEIKGQGFTGQHRGGDCDNFFLPVAFHMGEIDPQDFHLPCELMHPLVTELDGALSRRLHIFVDGGFGWRISQCFEQIGDALITQSQDVEEHAQAFQRVGLMIARDARRINAEGALAFQTPIASHGDLKATRIAHGFATVPLMLFEIGTAAFFLRVLPIT